MDVKPDNQGLKVLFVAYHYLPTKGTGIPGSMRTIKFVRNLNSCDCHVLTVRKPDVVESESPLGHLTPPINGETVHRAGALDLFAMLLRVRRRIKRLLGKTGDRGAHTTQVFKSQSSKPDQSKSAIQRFKDFIYNLFYFPDQESPWIPLAVIKGWRVVRRERINVIFATGSPWSGLLAGYFISRLTGIPLVVDFRDPWVGNPFHHSKGRFLDRLAIRMEKRLVRHATTVSLNTDALRDEFLTRYPDVDETKLIVLPNGYDRQEFDGLGGDSAIGSRLDEITLCHAGFLYGVRDPGPLLDAIRQTQTDLDQQGVRVRFIQIGHVKLDYDINQRYADLIDSGGLELLPQKSYRECLEYLSSADMLVNIQPGTQTQIPSKIYDYLALNKPILNITPADGALARMVSEYDFGALCSPEDCSAIGSVLRKLARDKRDGRPFEPYANRNQFDIERISEKLNARFQSIVFGTSSESVESARS
ncbi:glycosyltransferase [Saccharospirillum salsuginis]|uniref:Glycosyltransferase subfamily 4-like N-terminal domain-containing protein n=1 Tax=Saccharospirillum salsuginis TaxID=418750 RepID=A0A918K526_9GAMM|nr:glycosyltransferase [Saccharospirillum salsuginis]GGX49615.1 hypothetical protein GCM10007392_16190 [Saccharospirillum salsuginis]